MTGTSTYLIKNPLTSVTLAASPLSPQTTATIAATPVTLTATAVVGASDQYEFQVLAPSATTWTTISPYSASATASLSQRWQEPIACKYW